jgi:glutamate formiminotransferase / 5-formyltetrahydrofolate cyclo-ligase
VLECVINISEGRDPDVIAALSAGLAGDLLDVHSDPDHNRSVFTLIGEIAPRTLTSTAVQLLDVNSHDGVHPRLGVVDVVPFVPLEGSTFDDAVRARHDFATWATTFLQIPIFLYGPERTLPYVRKHAWKDLQPDVGPLAPHDTAGALCVGVRPPLVAYNLWLENIDLAQTRNIASAVRSPDIRTLGLQVGDYTQVSVNLINPMNSGPSDIYDAVAQRATIHHAELVGLLPAAVLANIPRHRWEALDVSQEQTIEWRLRN